MTVLFADLKGSMGLLADRDPGEARKILDPVLRHMMDAVHRDEGTVNQVMGDGIMAPFGAPIAHEDHAVRACYAALRMQESVKRYGEEARRTHGVTVQIRVGLNSGEVVVRAIGGRRCSPSVRASLPGGAEVADVAPEGTLPADTRRVRRAVRTLEGANLERYVARRLRDLGDIVTRVRSFRDRLFPVLARHVIQQGRRRLAPERLEELEAVVSIYEDDA